MALINCPNCGEEISDKAEYCVHCGRDITKETFESKKPISETNDKPETETDTESYVEEKNTVSFPEKTKKCVKCGNDLRIDDVVCSNCGSLQGVTKKESLINLCQKIKKWSRAGVVIFSIIAIIFFMRAWNVKNNYSNSEYSSHNVHAYVGGDAYNYIINGTYFTGLSVIGVGFMISAVISAGVLASVSIKEKESEMADDD